MNAYKKKPSLDLALGLRDPLCICTYSVMIDCICWIKVAEWLTVDGILESWEKTKRVIMEAWEEEDKDAYGWIKKDSTTWIGDNRYVFEINS